MQIRFRNLYNCSKFSFCKKVRTECPKDLEKEFPKKPLYD